MKKLLLLLMIVPFFVFGQNKYKAKETKWSKDKKTLYLKSTNKPISGIVQNHFLFNKKVSHESMYENGKMISCKGYYNNGQLSHETLTDSLSLNYHKNGALRSEGNWNEFEMVGVWKYYNKKGVMIDEYSYDDTVNEVFSIPAIGVNSSISNSNIFFGLDLSFQAKYPKSANDTISSFANSTELLKFRWATNIDKENKIHDFSLSLVELSSPLHISVLNFGTYFEEKFMWYYRPEIGVGYLGLEMFYSYNLFFKKQDSQDFDGQHMLNFRFSRQF